MRDRTVVRGRSRLSPVGASHPALRTRGGRGGASALVDRRRLPLFRLDLGPGHLPGVPASFATRDHAVLIAETAKAVAMDRDGFRVFATRGELRESRAVLAAVLRELAGRRDGASEVGWDVRIRLLEELELEVPPLLDALFVHLVPSELDVAGVLPVRQRPVDALGNRPGDRVAVLERVPLAQHALGLEGVLGRRVAV